MGKKESSLYHEDGGSMLHRNVSIQPQHYKASQSGRPRLESSSDPQISYKVNSVCSTINAV